MDRNVGVSVKPGRRQPVGSARILPLMQACPRCGRGNPDDANFCANCGGPLRREAARQERKPVTVVFCDLVGFTGLAEAMDPEAVRAVLSPYYLRVRRELERFGGTVEKFIGDAVVAVFGAPVVHEDDPERAVRAALSIRDWAREEGEVDVRIAVNTGLALVSLDRTDIHGEGMVAGDVVNTAARLQTAAPVNGILVGQQTHRATRNAITYAEHDPVAAKGKTEPVPAWEALAARSRLGGGIDQQPTTQFEGRKRELALLWEAFARARDEREPQTVTVVAVPGAGKSRLVYELSRLVDADPHIVYWRQGRCLPYGEGVSFWALAEIVKAETGILESDPPDEAARKLTSSVQTLLPEGETSSVERRLRPLVGLGQTDEAHGARDEAFPAWRRFFEALAERGPTVLVFEDLHWADDGLLDFLDALADATTGLPLLLVGTARPELLQRRPGWGGGKTNSVTFSLPPLTENETARLVQSLLRKTALEASLQRALLDSAGGNPLYAEEFARMIAERRDDQLPVPETVQGIIAARLDGLDPADKRLVQDASVVGSVFWSGAIAALSDIRPPDAELRLHKLERSEFIRRERRSSVEGETEYAFRHVLVRDAAYEQIPRSERSDRHRRAAQWIASRARPDDQAELLAHHYLEAITYARETDRDVGDLAGPAGSALREAGDHAFRLRSFRQAMRFFSAALELTSDEAERAELLFRYGSARYWWDSTGQDELAGALTQLQAVGHNETAARAGLLLARSAWRQGDREGVTKWLSEVDGLLVEIPDSMVQVEALLARASLHMVADENDAAITAATGALARLEDLDRPDLYARALDIVGTSRTGKGDEHGMEDQRRAVETARSNRAVWQMHEVFNNFMFAKGRFGYLRELDGLLEEWRTLFEEVGGTHYSQTWFLVAEAEFSYFAGRWKRAFDSAGRFLAELERGRPDYLEPSARELRGMIGFAQGQTSTALEELDRAVAVAQRIEEPQTVVPSLCLRATMLTAMGRTKEALADFDRLLEGDARLWGALSGSGTVPNFAWLAVDLDRRSDAEMVLQAGTFPRWTRAARAILDADVAGAAELLDEIGHRPAEAYARLRAGGTQLQRALQFYESVGATRYIVQCQRALAASA